MHQATSTSSSTSVQSQRLPTAMMSFVSVHKIVSKLKEDTGVISNYKQLANALKIPPSDYLDVEKAYKNTSANVYDLLHKIVELWSITKNNDSETEEPIQLKTVGVLASTLKKEGFILCAEELLSSYGSECIVVEEPSISTELLPILKRKWWPEPKPLPLSFVERYTPDGKLLVAELDDMLNQETRKAVISQQTCISGLGGIGKTTLAKWYANHFSTRFDLIIWLDCGENSLPTSIDNLWNRLCGAMRKESTPTVSDKARDCFAKFQGTKTLVIYDNAEEYEGTGGIKQVLPSTSECPDITCLVTSRCTLWGCKSMFGVIPQWRLDTLSKGESVQLLRSGLENVNANNADLEKLAGTLGYLPLALQIAIAHVNQHYGSRKNGVRAYNDALVESYESLLVSDANLGDYQKGLMATLCLTALKVKEQGILGVKAWRLLGMMAVLDPTVPLQFLMCIENMSLDMGLTIFTLLSKHSLVQLSEDAGDYKVTMHRLLQESLQLLCPSESIKYQSTILGCDIKAPSFATFKWKCYLKCRQRPDISPEYLDIAKNQINDGVSLVSVDWETHLEEAFVLLTIYDELNQRSYKPPLDDSNVEADRLWHLPETPLARTDVQWAHNYYYIDCIIAYLFGDISHRMGKKCEALHHWETSRQMGLKLMELQRKAYDSRTWITYIWRRQPKDWQDRVCLSDLLSQIEVVCTHVLFELGDVEKAEDAVKKITKNRRGRFSSSTHFPCTLMLKEVIGSHYDSLEVDYIDVSYDSAVKWVQRFSEHELADCTFEEVRFVRNDGSLVGQVDCHHVVTTKARRLNVESQRGDATKITFHMSTVWHGTVALNVSGCTMLWNPPNLVNNTITEISIANPTNSLPVNNEIWNHFPNLRQLSISNTQLSLSFIPTTLSKLELSGVTVVGSEKILNVPTLVLLFYEIESILAVTKLIKFEKLELSCCSWEEGFSCTQGEECALIKILKSSPKTKFYSPNQSLKGHMDHHGFSPKMVYSMNSKALTK